jgi:hypothetical protein
MRQLLHARCGRFGDEENFDVGLYGVLREVAAAAVDAVGRVKEEGEETGDAWCSGMLLRLYEVARGVYGAGAEFPNRVLAAAHGSLVADLVREEAMRGGGASAARMSSIPALRERARQRGVWPSMSTVSQATPMPSRARTVRGSSDSTAWCRGLLPERSATLGSAPRDTKK